MAELGAMTPDWKAEAFIATLGRPLVVGVATSQQGATLVEESDAAYMRMPVVFGEPVRSGQSVEVSNLETVRFPAYQRPATKPTRYWFIATGDGRIWASGEVEDPPQLEDGDELVIRKGAIRLTLP